MSPRRATYNTLSMSQILSTFLKPERLPTIDASTRPESIGHALLSNLIEQTESIEEIDINQLIIIDAGLVAIDARVIARASWASS